MANDARRPSGRLLPQTGELQVWREFIEAFEELRSEVASRLLAETALSAGDYVILLALSEAAGERLGAHRFLTDFRYAAQSAEQLGVQSVAHPSALRRGVDIHGGLGGPLIGGPIVPGCRVCHADHPVVGSHQPGKSVMHPLPLVAPLVDTLRLDPKIEDGSLDEMVDDLADVRQVIFGCRPDLQPTQSGLTGFFGGIRRCLFLRVIARAVHPSP